VVEPGNLFRSDDDYIDEIKKYHDSLLPYNMRAFKGGDEMEDCALHGTGGICLNGNKGKEVIEVVNYLFTQEAEKGGEVCAINSSIMTINYAEAFKIESVCKVDEESELIIFIIEKGKKNVFSGYAYRR